VFRRNVVLDLIEFLRGPMLRYSTQRQGPQTKITRAVCPGASRAPLEQVVAMGIRPPDAKAKRGGRRKKVEAA
jgi:hypothetical protein